MFSSGAIVAASAPFLFFLLHLHMETIKERAGGIPGASSH
jgi:hypothetical protein